MSGLVDALIDRLKRHELLLAETTHEPTKMKRLLEDDGSLIANVIKAPRWDHDSAVWRIVTSASNEGDLGLKIHPEMFPLASHLYESPKIIEQLANEGLTARIRRSYVTNERPLRVTIYDWVRGIPLGRLVANPDSDIAACREALHSAANSFLMLGIHPLIRDLDDYIVTNYAPGSVRLVTTDVNGLLDCSRSSIESRRRASVLLEAIIAAVVRRDYSPYEGAEIASSSLRIQLQPTKPRTLSDE